MRRFGMILRGWGFAWGGGAGAQQGSVTVVPPDLRGSRALEASTQTAVIRDYLQAWDSLGAAFDSDQASLLDQDFVGVAHDKLADTVAAQAKAGLRTRYKVRSHHLQFWFYSPEGQSIELSDTVEYTEDILDKGKVVSTGDEKTRYLVVLTPSEVRWRVRLFQAETAP